MLHGNVAVFRRAVQLLLPLVAAATTIRAQCPSGTPPPCQPSASVASRTAPSLSDRTWIVVPFTNVTRAPDLEWLRNASVNLLSLDLGRWTDICVIDDKRVADLMRTLPATRAAQGLSLNDGIALARQAGAGRLVMGDFIKVGRSTRLVANVFDTRNGSKLRSVQQPVSDPDSLLFAFAPLARGVLEVPPPADARVGATGTTSAEAYRDYLLGLESLNRFDLTAARRHLLAALADDSTFALAHYKLSIVMHWDARRDADERAHAVAAARLGASLPPRERALISSRLASATGDYERACTTLATLVQRDSSDAEALYGLGDCRYHAGYLTPEPTADSTRGRFRGDWNGAIAAFRRALLVDPTYHPAFEHLLDILTTTQVAVCVVVTPGCANNLTSYAAWILREGDSLVIEPVRGDFRVKGPMQARQESTHTPLLNLRAAQRIAREWTDAGPAEARAHLNLAYLDMRLGELAAAESELALIPATADPYARTNALEARVQTAISLGKGSEGRAALDSLTRELPEDSTKALRLGALAAAFGRVRPLVSAIDAYAISHDWSPERRAYSKHRPYALLGAPLPSMNDDERRYVQTLPQDTLCMAGRAGCPSTVVLPTLAYTPRTPRTWWPFTSAGVTAFRLYPAYTISRGDTARMLARTRFYDSSVVASHRAGNNDLAAAFHAGELYLALRDSTNALRATRWFTDSTLAVLARVTSSNDSWDWPYLLAPRMMKQRGDLAARLGYPAEARLWYERFLSIFGAADAEFKPEVDRVRTAVAALNGRR
jgi:tetratricopeptide (TPR) repeat protein